LIATARSGVKDESNAVVNQYLPGLLADVCGVEVEDYDVQPEDRTVPLELALPGRETLIAQARLWFDILRTTTSQVVATYRSEYYSGEPAITLNHFGEGQAIYIGTLGDDALHDTLLGWAVESVGIDPVFKVPSGVEAATRWHGNQQLIFLLNHTGETREISLPQPQLDLLTGTAVEKIVTIPPYGVFLLQEQE
jgi:beta-galactosidase